MKTIPMMIPAIGIRTETMMRRTVMPVLIVFAALCGINAEVVAAVWAHVDVPVD